MALVRLKEVLNYGGFFGGDTISAIAEPYEGGEEFDITIDEHVFVNLTDRYKIFDGFILDVERDGERITSARVVAAPERKQLKEAVDATTASEREWAYRVFAYRCSEEDLWVRGEPVIVGDDRYRCQLCGHQFGSS